MLECSIWRAEMGLGLYPGTRQEGNVVCHFFGQTQRRRDSAAATFFEMGPRLAWRWLVGCLAVGAGLA
jgi:hypothetical protein